MILVAPTIPAPPGPRAAAACDDLSPPDLSTRSRSRKPSSSAVPDPHSIDQLSPARAATTDVRLPDQFRMRLGEHAARDARSIAVATPRLPRTIQHRLAPSIPHPVNVRANAHRDVMAPPSDRCRGWLAPRAALLDRLLSRVMPWSFEI